MQASVEGRGSKDQGTAARAAKAALQASGRHRRPVATEIVPFSNFFPAEEYPQRYLERRWLACCFI
jgi:peptide-methionine (S)-S-oxide reductase